MAVLIAENPTYVDWMESLDPDGQVAAVIELLNQTNEILMNLTMIEGNLPTGNQTTVRTGLPTATWRRLYGGVPDSKSSRATVIESVGMLEAYNEIDKDLADLNGNGAAFRMSEARATVEGMNQNLASTLFYGNTTTNPERFDGFAGRYNSLGASNGENIIDAGGTGTDNASIWLVVWHPDTCFGLVPKGSSAGLSVTDKGQETLLDAAGNKYEGYRMHFQLKAGLCVKDWRYVVRIANIDRSTLTVDAATGANLPNLMFEAMERLPGVMSGARTAWYMDRSIRTKFRQQLASLTKQSTLEYQNVGGHRVSMWDEVPIHRVDVLSPDEARVV